MEPQLQIASPELCQTLFAETTEGIFISDAQGCFLEVNPQACEWLGYSRAELLRLSWQDLLPQQGLGPDLSGLAERNNSQTVRTQGQLRGKNGRSFSGEVRLRGLADGRRVALVRNLGEYGPVDETPHPYTLLAQHSRDIILIVSYNNGRIVEANASAIDIYGYSREELLSLSIQDLRAPETHALTTVQMAQAHTQGLLFETLHRRKDGRTFPVEVNSKGTILNGASVLISIIRDISERRQVEETLQQRETKYHQLFSEMSSAGALHEIICDSAGRPVDYITLEVNHAFEVLLNTKSEEVIGKKASEILPPAELHHWLEICGPVALTGQSTPYEMYSLFNQKYFEGNAYCPEKGKFAVTFTDITKRKQMEAEHQAHLRFFAAMDRVNRAIQGTNDLEQMMSDVLDVVLSIFDCDRAFLLYPCDPAAARWRVPMECTKPEYPGVLAMGLEMPMTPNVAETFRTLLAADGPVKFGSGTPYPLPADVSERFGFKSFIAMTLYPKLGQPWQFGLHQCAYARIWTAEEERLFQEIGRRLADALTSLLQYRTLRDSERRLIEAQRIAHIGYWERDLEAGRMILSDESCHIFGLAPQDFPLNLAQWHQRWLELIHPEDRERTAQAAAEALGDGPPYNVEYRIIRPNGEVRFIHSEAVVSSDESGRPRSMLGMMQDITERKLAEAALQRQVRMNNAYFTQSINCFVLFDRNFNFIRVNETFARNFGKNVEDFIGLTYPDVFPSDERYYERTHPLFDQIVRTKQPLRVFARPFTFVGQPERGETYWDWTMQPILDEKGEVEFIFFSSTDVTERKRAEDKVLYQANLLQNVSDAIIATDLDFKITSWNQAAETIYGWSAAAVIGQPAHEVLQSAFGVETWEQVMQQFLAQGFWQGETSQTRQDGSKVNVLASVSLIRDSAGRPIGAVTVNRDITERKQAETALRESEERFRLFMDNSPTIAWIQDDQSRYVYFNQTYEKRFGVQLAALRGKTIFELWPAEVAQQLWQNDQQVLAAGHLLEFTEEIPNFDGSPGTWWSLLFPFQDVSGQRYVAGIGLDITERGQMEEALYLTRFSVERAAEAIYWLDQEGHIVDVNETACRMLGYSREEMLQRSVFEVDPNITREFWQKGWQCLKDQPDKTLETIHRTRDGRLILVELGSNLVEFKGRVLSCTFARDITERKRVEAALRESEERFRLFMDNSPTIAWVKDEKGRHVYTNRTYENRYGMQLADYLGKTDFDLWPAEVAEQFRQSDQAVLAAGARMEYTEKIQNPDGSLGIWWTFKFPFQNASGQRYVAGIGLDITERQQMEEALYLTRFSVEHAADAIYWLDEQGHIVDVNETACRSLGYSREELLHLSITDIDSRHTPETWQQAWQFLKQHQTALIETTQRTKDGRLIPVEVIANYIEFEGRAFSCAFVRDITERKRAEAALRESEERFRLFMDNSPTTAWMKNEQGQYVYVNRTQENYFMASLQEWCGQTDFALWPRAVAEEFQQSDQRVLAAGHLLDFIQEIPNPDGSMDIRWVFKFPFQDVSGQRYVAGIGLDITERYRMEEALYLTRFSVEHAADAVYWLDEEGHIVDVNETACRMLGYSREEMLQFSLFDIDPGFTPEQLREGLQLLKQLGTRSSEWTHRTKDGRMIPVEVVANYIEFGGRALNCAFVRDISERKAAEEAKAKLEAQLRQAQKMESIGRLAGGVAHDFNNLLTVILGYSDLMQAQLPADDPLQDKVEQIQQAAERAESLTRQLLAFSRKQMLAPVVLDLNDLVENLRKMLGRLIGEDISLTTMLQAGLWSVKADPGQIEQVIMNLAVNARDAMPAGGRLILETHNVQENQSERLGSPQVLLVVTDSGHGMDEATVARIFEPFFTTKEQGKGTGLGLATVYGIVKQSGGEITVESQPGQGTSFKIYLPAHEVTLAHSFSPRPQQVARPGYETILLVEDNEMVRNLVRVALRNYGYTLLEAEQGYQALTLAEQHEGGLDLLLTDVVMPQMSGREVAERLKARYPHLKVLFMSGYTDDEVIRHGLLTDEVEFISKPFSPSFLAAKVREMLDE